MASSPQQHPLTTKVVHAMRTLYPEALADRSWDNVGLLLDNIKPGPGVQETSPLVLLTNDLTIAVAEEAIQKGARVIISYHPFLFRGIKSVSLNDPHQRILLQLVQNNIAVYSPHTALDAADGGINDWLADMLNSLDENSKRSVVQPIAKPEGYISAAVGYGRRVDFSRAFGIHDVVGAFAKALDMKYMSVATPKAAEKPIKSVAVCAGSGSGVLKDCDADLLFTGEMSHHDALKATMLGQTVVTVFHSNSERKYLRERLAPALRNELGEDIGIVVSKEDCDPFEIWRTDE